MNTEVKAEEAAVNAVEEGAKNVNLKEAGVVVLCAAGALAVTYGVVKFIKEHVHFKNPFAKKDQPASTEETPVEG